MMVMALRVMENAHLEGHVTTQIILSGVKCSVLRFSISSCQGYVPTRNNLPSAVARSAPIAVLQ